MFPERSWIGFCVNPMHLHLLISTSNVYREVRSQTADRLHRVQYAYGFAAALGMQKARIPKPTGIGDEVSRRTSSLRAIVSSPRSEMPGTDDRRRKHVSACSPVHGSAVVKRRRSS